MFIESWETWNGGVSLKYVASSRHGCAFIPQSSLINEVKFLTLLRVVDGTYSTSNIRNVMVQKWLSTQEYRLEQVAAQFYLLTAFNEDDHLIIGNGTWDFVDGDVIIRRPWTVGESLDKDPLPLVPQQVYWTSCKITNSITNSVIS